MKKRRFEMGYEVLLTLNVCSCLICLVSWLVVEALSEYAPKNARTICRACLVIVLINLAIFLYLTS